MTTENIGDINSPQIYIHYVLDAVNASERGVFLP